MADGLADAVDVGQGVEGWHKGLQTVDILLLLLCVRRYIPEIPQNWLCQAAGIAPSKGVGESEAKPGGECIFRVLYSLGFAQRHSSQAQTN